MFKDMAQNKAFCSHTRHRKKLGLDDIGRIAFVGRVNTDNRKSLGPEEFEKPPFAATDFDNRFALKKRINDFSYFLKVMLECPRVSLLILVALVVYQKAWIVISIINQTCLFILNQPYGTPRTAFRCLRTFEHPILLNRKALDLV